MSLNLLKGFADTGISQFKEKLDIAVSDNFEPTAYVAWDFAENPVDPKVSISITWKDPMERQAMENLTVTDISYGLVDYFAHFSQADLKNQEGKLVSLRRNGVFASQQDMLWPIEDFTPEEIENMEKVAKEFSKEVLSIDTDETVSSRGLNFGAGVHGIMFDFTTENNADNNVSVDVTTTEKVVGYYIHS